MKTITLDSLNEILKKNLDTTTYKLWYIQKGADVSYPFIYMVYKEIPHAIIINERDMEGLTYTVFFEKALSQPGARRTFVPDACRFVITIQKTGLVCRVYNHYKYQQLLNQGKNIIEAAVESIIDYSNEEEISRIIFSTGKTKIEEILDVYNNVKNKYTQNSLPIISISDVIGNEENGFSFTPEIEEKLFNSFFVKNERKVCRYTTLDSIYQTLTNKTFRLFGLAGMNDKGERDFLQKHLYNEIKWLKEDHQKIISELQDGNSTYIMSCSNNACSDKLEMWRLYADDAKGVCLQFEAEEKPSELLLKQIIYDKEEASAYTFIKVLITELAAKTILFTFKNFDKWKAFIKSSDYDYEKEIRLYYKEKSDEHKSKEWVKTTSHSIFNPYVEFALTEGAKIEKNIPLFPLKLKEIILGPKCPEKLVNQEQIKALLDKDPELKKLKIKVNISKIDNYR